MVDMTSYQEHPFAEYIRIIGKGKNGSRPLTEEEACNAMRMILQAEVEPVQMGAFLMLMRMKEESPEEVAGFVRATRDSINIPGDAPQVDLDWSSYAGKRRHVKDDDLDVQRLASVWRGESRDEYGEAAVISTAAIALQLMGKANAPDGTLKLAQSLWENRARDKTLAA